MKISSAAVTVIMGLFSAQAIARDCTIENDQRTDKILAILKKKLTDCKKIPVVLQQNLALRRLSQDPSCYPGGNYAEASSRMRVKYDKTIAVAHAWARHSHCNL